MKDRICKSKENSHVERSGKAEDPEKIIRELKEAINEMIVLNGLHTYSLSLLIMKDPSVAREILLEEVHEMIKDLDKQLSLAEATS